MLLQLPTKLIKTKHVLITVFVVFQLLFLLKIQQHNHLHNGELAIYDKSQSSVTYQKLLKTFPPKEFIKKSLAERCETYFDELFKIDEKWSIADLKDMSFSLEAFFENHFYQQRYKQLEEEYKKEGKPASDISPAKIFEELAQKKSVNKKIEESLVDNAGHLRIYGKCYTENDENNHPRCLEIESRLFPFLSFEPPLSERWDGTVVEDWLDISKYYQYDQSEVPHKGKKKNTKNEFDQHAEACYLHNFKHKMNGRGIVISIGDQFITEIVNLIKVLRLQGNKLPIEFVHKGDLAQESKTRIIDLARKDLYIPKLELLLNSNQQEVWFIDAKRCFLQAYYYNFSYFANKWVLVLFNSFEEMFLMDSDAVPFLQPNEFFNVLEDYKKTGAYFFRDRESGEQVPNEYKNMFLRMLPTETESTFFEIPVSTQHTLGDKFMKENARHVMEAGIVMMNRKQHLSGILMAVHIQFWGPLNSYIYGEKEIFWLGQSIAGDENYAFNPNPVGAIGKLQVEGEDRYIVGSHPAHLGPDNHTLLWINSGMETCKKHSWKDDFADNKIIKEKFNSVDEVKEFYMSPLVIEEMIIPPDAAKKFSTPGYPERGWENKKEYGCNGYYWMAHLKAGNFPQDPSSVGKEVRFNMEQKTLYNKISQLWVYPYEVREPAGASLTLTPAPSAANA